MGMLRVIVPPIGTVETVMANTRTGNTAEPTPLEPGISEEKVGAATIAGEASCWVPARTEEEQEKIPAPVAEPRVKPDSVMVTAEIPVGWAPNVRMS